MPVRDFVRGERVKVLQINSYFAGSVFYEDLYAAIDKRGISQDIYVFTYKGNQLDQTFGDRVHLRYPNSKWDKLIFRLKHKRAFDDLQKTLDIASYDISHAHSLFSNGFLALQTKRKYDIPYIVAVRNADINDFFKKAIHLRRIGNEILKEAERVIFISEAHRTEALRDHVSPSIREAVRKKSEVIPNAMNRFWIDQSVREKTEPKEHAVRLVYTGNIDKNKNVSGTLLASDELIRRGYDLRYQVVGKMRDEGVKKALEERSYAHVQPFTSNREELRDIYRENDIFVMPSRHETFGISYLEAMSQGLPVIYTKGQGFDGQFAQGSVGYAVTYDRPNEIADAVEAILADYRRISRTAIHEAMQFNWDTIAEKYVNIYQNCQLRAPEVYNES